MWRKAVSANIRDFSIGLIICSYIVSLFRSELTIAAAGITMGIYFGLKIENEVSVPT